MFIFQRFLRKFLEIREYLAKTKFTYKIQEFIFFRFKMDYDKLLESILREKSRQTLSLDDNYSNRNTSPISYERDLSSLSFQMNSSYSINENRENEKKGKKKKKKKPNASRVSPAFSNSKKLSPLHQLVIKESTQIVSYRENNFCSDFIVVLPSHTKIPPIKVIETDIDLRAIKQDTYLTVI